MKVLFIDNIDSFVYNLVQYVGEEGVEPIVVDNKTSMDEIDKIIEILPGIVKRLREMSPLNS